MSDLWGRPPGHAMKRKRLNSNFDIAIDTDSQDHFKRQNIDDGNDAIDLTPSHRIPDLIDSAAVDSTPTTSTRVPQPSQIPAPLLGHSPQAVPKPSLVPPYQTIRAQQFRPVKPSKQSTLTTKPQFSQQCTSISEPQPSNLPTTPSTRPYATSELEARSARNQLDKRNDESKAIRKWKPNEWNEDEFESDEENMGLAITMKLASELSLLKSFLELYRKFNIHLGDIVSGPRHKGFLLLISSSVTRLESHTARLRTLRDEKQRGNPYPGNMELIAEKITRRCKARSKCLWDLMEEKVDMANDVERATWVKKKKAVLGDVMGGLVGYLEELGDEDGWKEREVREMGQRWEKRWKVCGAMDREELKSAGWILDVGKQDG